MYRWYEKAVICYAYLNDVVRTEDKDMTLDRLRKSEWVSRGGTLQELLAPRNVVFLDKDWIRIGDKESLSKVISVKTGISQEYLHFYQKRFHPCTSRDQDVLGQRSSHKPN